MTQREVQRAIKSARRKIGAAIRQAEEVVRPLREDFYNGLRWEPDDNVAAIVAAEDLRARLAPIIDELVDVVRMRSVNEDQVSWLIGYVASRRRKEAILASLKDVEYGDPKFARLRLKGAIGGLVQAVANLSRIKPETMLQLETAWMDGKEMSESHEEYFLLLYNASVTLSRRSWTMLFYATEGNRHGRIRVTGREAQAFDDSDMVIFPQLRSLREDVVARAEEKARADNRPVDVIGSDGDVLYVAMGRDFDRAYLQPNRPGGLSPEQHRRARMDVLTHKKSMREAVGAARMRSNGSNTTLREMWSIELEPSLVRMAQRLMDEGLTPRDFGSRDEYWSDTSAETIRRAYYQHMADQPPGRR